MSLSAAGRSAKRLRLELRLDHAVTSILETLQPLAARAAVSVHLASRLKQQQQQQQQQRKPGASAGGSAASGPSAAELALAAAGAMQALTPVQAALLVLRLPGEARGAVQADLELYISTARALGRHKAELPLPWATAMQQEVRETRRASAPLACLLAARLTRLA